jgi:hypothetical protein
MDMEHRESTMSRVQKILDAYKNINTFEFYKSPPQRIVNFKSYYEAKVRSEGGESESLRQLKEFHSLSGMR